jgi:hypothetical protein
VQCKAEQSSSTLILLSLMLTGLWNHLFCTNSAASPYSVNEVNISPTLKIAVPGIRERWTDWAPIGPRMYRYASLAYRNPAAWKVCESPVQAT